MTKTAAVLGASGYGGAETLRLLAAHPEIVATVATAESQAGRSVRELYPHLVRYGDLEMRKLDECADDIRAADVVFCGLPHGEAMRVLPELGNEVVVDLGGDFRLDSADDYTAWYRVEHTAPGELERWAYGLPELFRNDVAAADRIASPGCYATAVVLAVAPLMSAGLIEGPIVADAASGTSGAGRAPKPSLHFAHVDEDVRAYKLAEHQHTPEMEMAIARHASRPAADVIVSFSAHLVPMVRGIHATCSAQAAPGTTAEQVRAALVDAYDPETFVDVRPVPPGTKEVSGSNRAVVSPAFDARSGRVIVVSVIDNLVKGAAGQAIQNANIALGLEETLGLPVEGAYP